MFSFEGWRLLTSFIEAFLQFLVKKSRKKISAVFFLQFLVIKTLDTYPGSLEMLDPDPQHCMSVGNIWDSPPSPTSVHPQLFCYIFPALCLCNPRLDPLGIYILRMGTMQSLLFAFQCKVNTYRYCSLQVYTDAVLVPFFRIDSLFWIL